MKKATDPESKGRKDTWRDVLEGVAGAAVIVGAFLTPFLRGLRSRWGLDATTAARGMPGDDLVVAPRWRWTHGIEIDAPADQVWPWVAQIGADRAGFYSYQWLENIVGCDLSNADSVHPEWEVQVGDALSLHPMMPPLPVVQLDPGRAFVVHSAPDSKGSSTRDRWIDCSWSFLVEPVAGGRSRVVSRYRCATSEDLITRLQLGPTLIEPVSFAMDRRMLRGIKQRAERREVTRDASQPLEVTA